MSKERNSQIKRTTSSLASSIAGFTKGLSSGQLAVGFASLCLIVIGIIMVYSASSIELVSNGSPAYSEALKQVVFVVIGLAAVALVGVLFKKGYSLLFVWVFYAACIVGILATWAFGTSQYGASRWISLGFTTIQPSEFAKIAFVLIAAEFVKGFNEGRYSQRGVGIRILGFIVLPLAILLGTQSDLGTTLICSLGVFAILFMSDVYPRKYLLCVLGFFVLAAVFVMIITPYRMARFTAFIDPWADADGNGFQYVHSFKALAAGGLFGVGIGDSYQKLLYLPMASTDFIFAIVGEELGLVGAACVILLFLLLLYGGLKMATEAKSDFAFLAASSLILMLVFQAFLNISCVIGAAPITGKPLPFISSGGSSMVSSIFLVGLVFLFGSGVGDSDVYERRRGDLRIVSSSSSGRLERRRAMDRKDASSLRRSSSRASERPAGRRASTYGKVYDSQTNTRGSGSLRVSSSSSRRRDPSAARRARDRMENRSRSRDGRAERRGTRDERSTRRYR